MIPPLHSIRRLSDNSPPFPEIEQDIRRARGERIPEPNAGRKTRMWSVSGGTGAGDRCEEMPEHCKGELSGRNERSRVMKLEKHRTEKAERKARERSERLASRAIRRVEIHRQRWERRSSQC